MHHVATEELQKVGDRNIEFVIKLPGLQLAVQIQAFRAEERFLVWLKPSFHVHQII